MVSTCPVKEGGVELRSGCAACDGRPAYNQISYKKRKPLYLEEESSGFVFAVIDGFLRETRTMPDGRAQTVRLIGPGELAGAEALVGRKYHTSVETLTAATVCKVPATEVRELIKMDSDRAIAICGALVDEVRTAHESVLWLGTLTAEERVLALVDKLRGPTPKGTFFRVPLTRLDMAEVLGLAHATVSRTLQALSRRGVIEVRGRWLRLS
ncbi:Crp/Fnr family transcriptional regulator [Myxococcota bacterium]|nr:Crp/Fnr family transcriptional regulator [Myxococcota bacterium]